MGVTGIVLAGRGEPASLEELAPYLQSVTGAPPDAVTLEAEETKYLAIGAGPPANRTSERLAAALERRLSGIEAADVSSSGDEMLAMVAPASTRGLSGVRISPYVRERADWVLVQMRRLGGPAYLRGAW